MTPESVGLGDGVTREEIEAVSATKTSANLTLFVCLFVCFIELCDALECRRLATTRTCDLQLTEI